MKNELLDMLWFGLIVSASVFGLIVSVSGALAVSQWLFGA